MVRFDYGVVLIESLKKSVDFTDAKAVAHAHNLSPSLMEKVAQEFRRAGWLESRRGFGGGYKLANAGSISMEELIKFFRWPAQACPIIKKIK